MSSLNGSIHQHCARSKDENQSERRPFVAGDPLDHSHACSAPNLLGSDLTTSDFSELESRWIDRALAVRAGLRRVDSLTGAEIIGRRTGKYAGIVIPYFHPGSDRVREYRLRRDQPDLEYDAAGNLKIRQKYLSPPGRSNMLYVVPDVTQEALRDATLPILITEGEFKALALWRLANHGSRTQPRFLPWEFLAFTTGAEPSAKPLDRTAPGWT